MIIFVKTRYEYDSYQDFWELVTLSEFPIVHPDEIDWQSDNTYILTPHNGEIPNPLPERKCKMIWLNIERPTSDYDKSLWRQFDEVWLCDRNWSVETGQRFFFMASDSRLGYSGVHSLPPVSLAYMAGRRIEPYEAMNLNNVNCFGQAKKLLLANAKALVVLHQDVPVLSPQRFCYAAAAHLPVFYEEVPDFYPFIPYVDFIPITYHNCVGVVKDFMNNPNLVIDKDGLRSLQDVGENLHKKMCVDTNFRAEVLKMFENN